MRFSFYAFLLSFCLSCGINPAQASSLQISPVLIEFFGAEEAQGIWLRNSGTQPINAQLRLYSWEQRKGKDVLESTPDIVASPPFIRIPAQSEQLVRIVLRHQMSEEETRERAYRVLVDELPPGDVEAQRPGLQFLLRYSVPIFVTGRPQGSKPVETIKKTDISAVSVSTAFSSEKPQVLTVNIGNLGSRRLKISQLTYISSDGKRTELTKGLLGYVLAGQRMFWEFKEIGAGVGQRGGRFECKVNNDVEAQTLSWDAP